MKGPKGTKYVLTAVLLVLGGCVVVPVPIPAGQVAIGRTSAETLPDFDFIDADGCRIVVNRETGEEFQTC